MVMNTSNFPSEPFSIVSIDDTISSQSFTSSYFSTSSICVWVKSGASSSSSSSFANALPTFPRVLLARGAFAARAGGLAELDARPRFFTPSSVLGCLAQYAETRAPA